MASATGSYTGNDATNRTIALAFTPKLVVIDGGTLNHLFVSNVNTGTYGQQIPQTVTQHEAANATRPALTTNGFVVSGTATSNTNRNTSVYYYFASG